MASRPTFKVGDVVRVRKDLYEHHGDPDELSWTPEMDEYDGQVVTISGVHTRQEYGYVTLAEDDRRYMWSPLWLEPVGVHVTNSSDNIRELNKIYTESEAHQ